MTNTEGEVLLAPTTADRMNVRGADATCFNLNVNVMITKRLWLKLGFVELRPGIRPFDLEARESLWIPHYEMMQRN